MLEVTIAFLVTLIIRVSTHPVPYSPLEQLDAFIITSDSSP